jgi:hypothetical protein
MGPLGMPSLLGRQLGKHLGKQFDPRRKARHGVTFRAAQLPEYHLVIILEENCAMLKIRPNGIANSKISRNFYFYLNQILNTFPAEAGDNRPNVTGACHQTKG